MDQVLIERRDRVAVLTFNRPDRLNAISGPMLAEAFDDHVHHVYLQLLPLFATRDFREGMASFLERRAPDFEGR